MTQAFKPLTDDDLADAARRIADYARSTLEARDRVWLYLPGFRDEVAAEALIMLKSIVQHERMVAKQEK